MADACDRHQPLLLTAYLAALTAKIDLPVGSVGDCVFELDLGESLTQRLLRQVLGRIESHHHGQQVEL